jgi:uncharacterized protein (TIGR03067 family)
MIRSVTVAILIAASSLSAQTSTGQARQNKPPASAPSAAVPAALKPLQGSWVLTTPDGQPLAPGDLVITFTGDAYAQSVGGAVNERGTIKIDATKKPMWIDLAIKEGADAGKTQVGLIEIAGATMKGVFGQAGSATRPTSLTPAAGVISFVGKKKT